MDVLLTPLQPVLPGGADGAARHTLPRRAGRRAQEARRLQGTEPLASCQSVRRRDGFHMPRVIRHGSAPAAPTVAYNGIQYTPVIHRRWPWTPHGSASPTQPVQSLGGTLRYRTGFDPLGGTGHINLCARQLSTPAELASHCRPIRQAPPFPVAFSFGSLVTC